MAGFRGMEPVKVPSGLSVVLSVVFASWTVELGLATRALPAASYFALRVAAAGLAMAGTAAVTIVAPTRPTVAAVRIRRARDTELPFEHARWAQMGQVRDRRRAAAR